MRVIKQVIADAGKVVSTDRKTYHKVLWCDENTQVNQIHEITDEEYDGLKNVYDGSGEEFYDGIEVRPNQYYFYEGHRYVYMGERKTANSWADVEQQMGLFDEE